MGLGFCPIKAVEGAAAALAVVVQPKAMLALSIGENDADTSAEDMTAEKKIHDAAYLHLIQLKNRLQQLLCCLVGTFADISILF